MDYPANRAVFSGSADAADSNTASNVSIFEALERACYLDAKENRELVTALKLGQKVNQTKIPFSPLSGTGTAIHRTPERAILGGILEVLERDAYLCHWYTGRPPERLPEAITPESSLAQQKAQAIGLEFNLFRLRTPIPDVHVVLATTKDKSFRFENTGFCSGISASFCLRTAVSKALFELDRFVDLYFRLGPEAQTIDLPSDHPMTRFYMYLKPENLDKLSVFLEGQSRQTKRPSLTKLRSKTLTLDTIVRSLEKLNHDVIVFPFHVPEMLKNHLFCSQVFIPSLQQLDYEDKPVLNPARLRDFHPEVGSFRNLLHPLP